MVRVHRLVVLMVALVAGVGSGGCSLVLDPDELVAASAGLDADTTGEAGETGGETTTDTNVAPDSAETLDSETDAGVDVETATDVEPGKEVIVLHSGAVSCTLFYREALTQCPETCGAGWTYVVDASTSKGVGSFSWTFAATQGFSVSPQTASGARVVLTLEPPECLVGGTNMVPFEIVARLATDGGQAKLVDLPSINPGFVTSCSGADSCPAP